MVTYSHTCKDKLDDTFKSDFKGHLAAGVGFADLLTRYKHDYWAMYEFGTHHRHLAPSGSHPPTHIINVHGEYASPFTEYLLETLTEYTIDYQPGAYTQLDILYLKYQHLFYLPRLSSSQPMTLNGWQVISPIIIVSTPNHLSTYNQEVEVTHSFSFNTPDDLQVYGWALTLLLCKDTHIHLADRCFKFTHSIVEACMQSKTFKDWVQRIHKIRQEYTHSSGDYEERNVDEVD